MNQQYPIYLQVQDKSSETKLHNICISFATLPSIEVEFCISNIQLSSICLVYFNCLFYKVQHIELYVDLSKDKKPYLHIFKVSVLLERQSGNTPSGFMSYCSKERTCIRQNAGHLSKCGQKDLLQDLGVISDLMEASRKQGLPLDWLLLGGGSGASLVLWASYPQLQDGKNEEWPKL